MSPSAIARRPIVLCFVWATALAAAGSVNAQPKNEPKPVEYQPRPGDTDLKRKLDALKPAVRDALRGNDPEAQRAALAIVADLPPAGAEAFSAPLADFLKLESTNPELIALALRTYGKTFPEAKDIASVLDPHLKSGDIKVRRAAADATAALVASPTQGARSSTNAKYFLAMAVAALPFHGIAIANPDADTRKAGLDGVKTVVRELTELYSPTRLTRDEPRADDPKDPTAKWAPLAPVLKSLDEQLPRFVSALNAADADSRVAAARTLEQVAALRSLLLVAKVPGEGFADPFKTGLTAVMPTLVQRAKDPVAAVRQAVVEAVEPLDESLLPKSTIVAATSDANVFVRWSAARTLGKLGQANANQKVVAPEVGGLATLLSDSDVDVRVAALTALQKYGAAAKSATPAVLVAASKGDVEARVMAIKTLDALGSDAPSTVPVLIQGLKESDIRLRREAAGGLVRFGPDAKPALVELRRALESDDAELRVTAAEAILALNRKPRLRDL